MATQGSRLNERKRNTIPFADAELRFAHPALQFLAMSHKPHATLSPAARTVPVGMGGRVLQEKL